LLYKNLYFKNNISKIGQLLARWGIARDGSDYFYPVAGGVFKDKPPLKIFSGYDGQAFENPLKFLSFVS